MNANFPSERIFSLHVFLAAIETRQLREFWQKQERSEFHALINNCFLWKNNQVAKHETTEKIPTVVLVERRLKVLEIVDVIDLSPISILNDYRGMGKLSAKWVLRSLIIGHGMNHVTNLKSV